MAKATLTYDLPEEHTEFMMATHASDMWAVLSELDGELRSHLKYGSHPKWHEETVDDIRKLLLDLRQERGINFD